MLEPFSSYGFWWIPKNEKQCRGILSFTKEDGIKLKIFEERLVNDKVSEIPLILGTLENGNSITLYKSYEFSRKQRFPGLADSEYEVLYAFKKVHLDSLDKLIFNRISGRFQLLNKWWNRRNFKWTVHDDGKGVEVRYELPDSSQIALDSSIKLQVYHRFTANLIGIDDQVTIKQFCYFRIESSKGLEFLDLLNDLLHFQDFLTFISFERCFPLEIKVNIENSKVSERVEIIYKPGFDFEQYIDIPRGAFLFYNEGSSDDVLLIIKNWYLLRKRIEPVFRLLMLSFYHNQVFHVNQFLNLCQALETFHLTMRERDESGRKIMSGTFSLKNRVTDILNELPEFLVQKITTNKDVLAAKISSSRNYYTHFDPKKKAKAISELECYSYAKKLQFMIVILIINELGFPKEKINELIEFCSWRFFRAAQDS
jgi:hypothetical protein